MHWANFWRMKTRVLSVNGKAVAMIITGDWDICDYSLIDFDGNEVSTGSVQYDFAARKLCENHAQALLDAL